MTADFKAAATLWSWFYMDDPPMDYNVTAEVDGNLYDLADIKGVETLEASVRCAAAVCHTGACRRMAGQH